MVFRTRKEWLEENKKLLLKVLEHITNVTNIGLHLHEENNNLIISYPIQNTQNSESGKQISPKKTELIFCQDPDNGMKVRHRLPNGNNIENSEIVARVPASDVDEKFIYETVISFLERIQNRTSDLQ